MAENEEVIDYLCISALMNIGVIGAMITIHRRKPHAYRIMADWSLLSHGIGFTSWSLGTVLKRISPTQTADDKKES